MMGLASGFLFSQSATQDILANWLLLDNQSTTDLFCNTKLLKNIRRSDTCVNVCNAGRCTMTMVGDLPGYGTVWYDLESIANVLSLKRVAKKYHVTFDSKHGGSFIVTKPGGTVFKFKQSAAGLYFLDTNKTVTFVVNNVADNKGNYTNDDYLKALCARELYFLNANQTTTVIVNTVADNKGNYTNDDYLKALCAREQIKIGRSNTKHFIWIVTSNWLPNCPVTRADIIAAEHIFGPNVGSIKSQECAAPNTLGEAHN
jgi:hypothetical protein